MENGWAWFWFVMFLLAVMPMAACSPRAWQDVNKQAPEPPVYGERPGLSGALMYTEESLRDPEPLDYD